MSISSKLPLKIKINTLHNLGKVKSLEIIPFSALGSLQRRPGSNLNSWDEDDDIDRRKSGNNRRKNGNNRRKGSNSRRKGIDVCYRALLLIHAPLVSYVNEGSAFKGIEKMVIVAIL